MAEQSGKKFFKKRPVYWTAILLLFTVLIFVTKSKTAGMPYGQYPGQAPYQGPMRQNDQPPVPPSFPAEQEKMPWEETQKK